MKSLFIKSERYVCDESSAGEPPHLRLPCTIFLAAAYCRKQGLDVDVLNVPDDTSYSYAGYDVVVSWVALLEGFYDGIEYLNSARKSGKIAIMILNDPFEGLEMEAMEKYPFIDYTVRLYERELVLGELLTSLEKGLRKPSFTGLIWRNDSGIIDNGTRPPHSSLEHLPSTAEFLREIDLSRYEHVFLEAGRGCPNSCTFCFYRQTKPRKRKIEDLVSELSIVAGKVSHIWLHDLNMMADIKWTEHLCDAIIESGIKARWGTDARMDLCIRNPGLLKRMHKAGCYLLALGVESVDDAILERIQKKAQASYIDQAVRNCTSAGIRPLLTLMIGFPWDTNETLQKMEDVLYKSTYSHCDFQFVRPLRGTPLYQEYKDLGLLQHDLTIDDYVNIRHAPSFPTLTLSKEQLIEWERRLVEVTVINRLRRGILSYWVEILKRLVRERDFRRHTIKDSPRYIKIALKMLRAEKGGKKC